jgi:regulatory protein
MARITALEAGKKQQKRVNLFLDGRYAFSLDAELAVREGLQQGQELDEGKIGELREADSLQRCLDAANKLLGYRPRSESEMTERLARRAFDSTIIETTLARLKRHELLDDVAFARFWQENRSSFSPRSRWLTAQELRLKGVGQDVIDAVAGEVDDRDNAYRAALDKARSIPAGDYNIFRRRLGDFLRRRGFGYGTIKTVIEQVWSEYGKGS